MSFFSKNKYKFNPESLKFDKVSNSVRRTIVKVFTFFTATLALTVIYYLIFSQFFHTPKERIQMREVKQMEENYAILKKNYNLIEDVLADIQLRDSNLYRTIFESEPPVQQTYSRAGFGGFNLYEALEGYSNADLIKDNKRRSETLLKQVRDQYYILDGLLEKAQEKREQLIYYPSIQPVENGNLNRTASGFGWRMHPIYRTKMFHTGMDFTAPIGTPVRATANGRILETRTTAAQGKKIVIDHGYGFKTVYTCLDKFLVTPGQRVTRGEIIGHVGNTGMSIAPHLHYEVHKNGKPVDPVNYFFSELSPAAFARIRDLSNLGRTFD